MSDGARAMAFNLIDMVKCGGQKSSLDSLEAREETLNRRLYERHQPQRCIKRSNQLTDFFFFLSFVQA